MYTERHAGRSVVNWRTNMKNRNRTGRLNSSRTAVLTCCLIGINSLIGGCSSGSMTSELVAKPESRSLAKLGSSVIHLPRDEKFSIALAPAQKSPGLLGTADANSQAAHEGNASLSASVDNGGGASATFQIGHAFSNDTDRQMDLHVRVRFDYEYSAGAKPPSLSADGLLGMDVYARSTRGKLLKTIPVLSFSTSEGDLAGRGNKEAEFVVTLGPADGAIIFVGGNIQITTKDGHSANGVIKLSKLEMDVEPKTAPATSVTTRPATAP